LETVGYGCTDARNHQATAQNTGDPGGCYDINTALWEVGIYNGDNSAHTMWGDYLNQYC
jgi:hypothetical protein